MTFIEPCMLARIMDNQVWFEAYLRDTSGKGGSVRFAHHLHPREAGCRYGDHPFGYRNGCRNGAHRYNHDLASADSSRGAGDGCPMYFVNSWALGWSRDP